MFSRETGWLGALLMWNLLRLLGTLIEEGMTRILAEVGKARLLCAPLEPFGFWDITVPE